MTVLLYRNCISQELKAYGQGMDASNVDTDIEVL